MIVQVPIIHVDSDDHERDSMISTGVLGESVLIALTVLTCGRESES